MEPVFDKPQWEFRLPQEGVEVDDLSIMEVECHKVGEAYIGSVKVVPGTSLFKYIKDVIEAPSIDSVRLYLEQEDKRWYLSIEHGHYEYDLWYYTKANLPIWAKEVYGE